MDQRLELNKHNVVPVVASETVRDFNNREVVVVRICNSHIALQCHSFTRHVLDLYRRQVGARLLHVSDLVRHEVLRLVHQRGHSGSNSKKIRGFHRAPALIEFRFRDRNDTTHRQTVTEETSLNAAGVQA